MDIRFNSGYTKLTIEGIVFKIGDYVSSGRTKGTIVGIDGNEGDVLLDTGRIISYENVKHAPKPASMQTAPPALPQKKIRAEDKPALQKTDKRTDIEHTIIQKSRKRDDFDSLAPNLPDYSSSNSECHAKVARLERELEECNSRNFLPEVVLSAPPHMSGKLPEARTNDLKKSIEQSVENLVIHSQAGDSSEVKKAEKEIVNKLVELKEVAPQSTVSVTENCRVQISKVGGRDTIRIYFGEKPDKSAATEIGKHGFRAYSETVNGRKEWYWGAFSNDKRLAFAKSFCNDEIPTINENNHKEYAAPNSPLRKRSKYEILNANEDELLNMYSKYGKQSEKYGIKPRFENYEMFSEGLLAEYTNDAPKKLYPDFILWAKEWVNEYPDWIDDDHRSRFKEKPSIENPPRTIQTTKPTAPAVKAPKSNKIVLSSLLKELMPKHQQAYLRELDAEGVQEMQPVIDNIERQISSITKRQDGKQAIVKAHYFYGGSDWYVTEYEGEGIIYGFAILNDDYDNSEFGRSSVQEFNDVGRVEMDFYWTPRPLDEVLYRKDPDYYPEPKSTSKSTNTLITPAPEQSEKDKESSDVLNSIKSILERVAAAAAARANNK